MNAFVIVHLSSLDSYAEKEGLAAARALAQRLFRAAEEHEGTVYVIDQRWPYRGKASEIRRGLTQALSMLALRQDLKWVFWDETNEDWDFFLRRFIGQVAKDGAQTAVVAGIWYDPKGELGCATDVERALRQIGPVRVAPELVACWSTEESDGGGR